MVDAGAEREDRLRGSAGRRGCPAGASRWRRSGPRGGRTARPGRRPARSGSRRRKRSTQGSGPSWSWRRSSAHATDAPMMRRATSGAGRPRPRRSRRPARSSAAAAVEAGLVAGMDDGERPVRPRPVAEAGELGQADGVVDRVLRAGVRPPPSATTARPTLARRRSRARCPARSASTGADDRRRARDARPAARGDRRGPPSAATMRAKRSAARAADASAASIRARGLLDDRRRARRAAASRPPSATVTSWKRGSRRRAGEVVER